MVCGKHPAPLYSLLQENLNDKVNASDIASLMPSTEGDEGASLMPKLLELQTKINGLEGVCMCGCGQLGLQC
jgi:hypothetical protein